MFQHYTQWNVTVKGFAGRTIRLGQGNDVSGNDASIRYGELDLVTDNEFFSISGKSISYGDVSMAFPGGPLFIGNNPEIGPPSIELHFGDRNEHRNIDPGVDSIFDEDGVHYVFHRPKPDDGDYKVMNVTITKA